MLGVGYGLPRLGVVHQVPEIGHHSHGHDNLVEMIEVIGRQQRLLVDIGALKAAPDFLQLRRSIRTVAAGYRHCNLSS